MTAFDRIERRLPVLLDELASPGVPDYYDDLMAITGATTQRPAWAFVGRWLPAMALRLPATPPLVPWRLGVVATLLVAAAIVAALAVGAFLDDRAPAHGPAANGVIVFVDQAGRVVVGDPGSGRANLLIETTHNTKPIFSPDGTRFLVIRPAAAGSQHLHVVDLEGVETRISLDAVSAWHYVGWSPSGDQVLVRDEAARILLFDTDRTASPFSITRNLGLHNPWIGAGMNYRTTTAFRPPHGDEILFTNDDRVMYAVRRDGTGLRTILDLDAFAIGAWIGAMDWSPSGDRIAFSVGASGDGPVSTWLVDADGGSIRPLSRDGHQGNPTWSPDGRWIAVEHEAGDLVKRIAILDAGSGELVRHVGPPSRDGWLTWDWSPDGTSIVQLPRDGFGKVLIVDVASGEVTDSGFASDQPVTWQRLKPRP